MSIHVRGMLDLKRETGWLIMTFAAVTQVASSVFLNAVLFQGRAFELLR